MKPRVICHISSLHYRKDLRIFVRECRSLAHVGYEVHYLVADGLGSETDDNVHIHDIGLRAGFPHRFRQTHQALMQKALSLKADIYHFHDPELMWMGWQLKKQGHRVIADVHEDVPNEFYGSPNKSYLRRLTSYYVLDWLEQYTFPKLDAVITSSPIVEQRLYHVARRIVNIGCFPNLEEEFDTYQANPAKEYDLVYVGSIAPMRGVIETVQLLEGTNWKYGLMGDFQGVETESILKHTTAWSNQVDYYDFTQKRQKVVQLLQRARIGLATLLPHPSYATAYCLKIFEYMAVGIPVIATNFPFWTELIEECQCGITVDSTKPHEIKQAIQYLLAHPEEAERMGSNGRNYIEKKYNWATQETKLLKLYSEVLADH